MQTVSRPTAAVGLFPVSRSMTQHHVHSSFGPAFGSISHRARNYQSYLDNHAISTYKAGINRYG
jgi:hypothetical protein